MSDIQRTIDGIRNKYYVDKAIIIASNEVVLDKLKSLDLQHVTFLKVDESYISNVTKDDNTVLILPHFDMNRLIRMVYVDE